jgi:hypothetical protein
MLTSDVAPRPDVRRHTMRRLASLSLLAVAATVALSGCFKLDMGLEIQSDDTVDGSIVIAVARDQAEFFGGEDALRESIQGESDGLFTDAPESGTFEQRDYEDDEWIGTESVFDGVPIEEFGSEETGDLSITRDGDEFVVVGSLDLSNDGQDEAANAILDTAEIDISITFPGDVSESNGLIDGNEVSWEPTPGEVLEISARGAAEAGPPWMMIAAIGALVALVAIGVVLLVILRGRQPAADGPPAEAAPAEAAPAEAAPADQPVDVPEDSPGAAPDEPREPPVVQ